LQSGTDVARRDRGAPSSLSLSLSLSLSGHHKGCRSRQDCSIGRNLRVQIRLVENKSISSVSTICHALKSAKGWWGVVGRVRGYERATGSVKRSERAMGRVRSSGRVMGHVRRSERVTGRVRRSEMVSGDAKGRVTGTRGLLAKEGCARVENRARNSHILTEAQLSRRFGSGADVAADVIANRVEAIRISWSWLRELGGCE
jgi:hypothetical protein